jgi:hypothetical protein
MAKWPAKYSGVELVLGSIGYDELFNNNDKFADLTLQYAKQSLADLEAGRELNPPLGVKPWEYKSKDDAIAWMNLTIGTLFYASKKDKAAAQKYLYAATKAPAASDVSNMPNPYEFIGHYYTEQLDVLSGEIRDLIQQQDKPDLTQDALKTIVDKIKAKVAVANALAERAMDAYARAYSLGTKPEYKTRVKGLIASVYHVRYGSSTAISIDDIIAGIAAKPFPDPTAPVTPVFDP